MEAELDATLGYEKNHKGDLQTDNKRNGHSTKNLKSQYGEFQIVAGQLHGQRVATHVAGQNGGGEHRGTLFPYTTLFRSL